MAVRRPTRTITRTYLYLDQGKFPAIVRYVNKKRGVDLKHSVESLAEVSEWVDGLASPPPPRTTASRSKKRTR